MFKMKETFDCKTGEYIEKPKEMELFLLEIEEVCKKYGFSISHQDIHGAFIIQKYKDFNISCLKFASKDY